MKYRGSIDQALRPLMENWIFGCDACQKDCPYNRARSLSASGVAPPTAEPAWKAADPAKVLQMDAEAFGQAVCGSPLRGAGRENVARNAAIALGNTGAAEHLAVLEKAASSDPSLVVREQAQWAIRRIQKRLER
jgi:epoxyqueuosine reductase